VKNESIGLEPTPAKILKLGHACCKYRRILKKDSIRQGVWNNLADSALSTCSWD
jgi:hypothetical protein